MKAIRVFYSLAFSAGGHLRSREQVLEILRQSLNVKRLAGLCMAFSFRGAHTARGSFGSQLSNQRSSPRLGSSLGSSSTALSIVSHCARYPPKPQARAIYSSNLSLHRGISHAGASPSAAACKAGSRNRCHSLARQQGLCSDSFLSTGVAIDQHHIAPSRRTAASCSLTAESSQDVQSTTAFQTPPTYVKANGRIIASKISSS